MKNPLNRQKVAGYVKEHAGILCVCFLFLLVGLISLNQVLVYTPDSARYLAWSQSLGHLEGFRDNTAPEPSKYVVHAPLYPVLLAPTAWLSTENVIPAKLLTTFFGIALLATVYWWTKVRIGTWRAVLLCSVLAMHPAMVLYSTQVLSDVPFTVCVLLFLNLIERETADGTGSGSYLLALTATMVCGLFLREVGLTLVMSCTAMLFLKRNYKTAFLILAVSIGFYVLWYIRNEVLVAGIEHPPLQNSQVFFRHFFTPSSVSILGEFTARFRTNAAIYGANIIQLPFLSETILRGISTMAPNQFPIVLVLGVMPYVYHFLLILTAVLVLVGAYDEFRHGTKSFVLAVFLGFYLVPILLYPISDSRFLFPLLIIVLYLLVGGFTLIIRDLTSLLKRPEVASWATIFTFVLLAVPNIAWTVTYASNNFRYGRSPLGFFDTMRNETAYPALFARPAELAGKWLAENTDSSTVIISRWKELGVYTRGRKLLDMDPQTLVDPFEYMVRDYDVRYIVTAVSRGGLREYEQLFAQSKRFHFTVVQRFADLEIVKVEKGQSDLRVNVSSLDSTENGVRLRFARAIRLLEQNRPTECEGILNALPVRARNQIPAVFNVGVAKEFAGKLDEANTMFERFHQLQQAGSVVQPAWYHLEIISKLRDTIRTQSGVERAMIYQTVGAYYWIMGFRTQSLLMLDRSIAADSTFFPPIILRATYSLLNGDTLKSEQYLARARQLDPANVLVRALSKIFENFRILVHRHSLDVDRAVRFENVRQLDTMGLRENVIDGLLEIHAQYPDDTECLRMLVDLYNQKGRYAPALAYLKELSVLIPNDPDLQKELSQLENRW
jgi:tetratricopeptide (TPR) repeat protein